MLTCAVPSSTFFPPFFQSVLEHFIVQSELSRKPTKATPFDGPLAAPGTSVHAFLEHIMNSGLCSKVSLVVSLHRHSVFLAVASSGHT